MKNINFILKILILLFITIIIVILIPPSAVFATEFRVVTTSEDTEAWTPQGDTRIMGGSNGQVLIIKKGTTIQVNYEPLGSSKNTPSQLPLQGTPYYVVELSVDISVDGGTIEAGSLINCMYLEEWNGTELVAEEDTNLTEEEKEEVSNMDPNDVYDIDKNATWDEIPVNSYNNSDLETSNYLYELLMDVNIADLNEEEKEAYKQRCFVLANAINNPGGTIALSSKALELLQKVNNTDKPIYTNPLFGLSKEKATNVTPDKIVDDAENFIDAGQNSNVATINQENADTALNSIYNILLAIAISITVIWGLVIAIKLMISSVEEKAEYKQMLWPYLIGCIIIFGSFIIWRIVIIVMNNVL